MNKEGVSMYICQLGNGYMLYSIDNAKYNKYCGVEKTGYPYPDIDKFNNNQNIMNQIDNLYEYIIND